MAKAKFDIEYVKTEATKGLHAGVGAADLALETVKGYVTEAGKRFEGYQKDAQKAFADVQKSVSDFDFEPKALRDQATTVVTARVDSLTKDAAARRTAVEKRVSELQVEAQKFVADNAKTATATYGDLAKRGEGVVAKLRGETPAPAKKAPAKKTAAKKAPAKKTAAKKAPATKAAASS